MFKVTQVIFLSDFKRFQAVSSDFSINHELINVQVSQNQLMMS